MSTNNTERPPRPIGPIVTIPPAIKPTPTTLVGKHSTLIPLLPSHAEGLYPILCGAENAFLWDYMFPPPFLTYEPFADFIRENSRRTDAVYFALCTGAREQPLGFASLMSISVQDRSIEIGNVMLAPALQGTTAATDLFALLMRHAFDDLGFRRVVWKCNLLNAPSSKAALRLGFHYEGIFRKHLVVKGRNRDTWWASVVSGADEEGGESAGMVEGQWELVKEALDAWLDQGNFDDKGRQKVGLREVREEILKRTENRQTTEK